MTKPSRSQEQACERLAEAVVLIAEAARLDGRGRLGPAELADVLRRLAGASSAFDADQVAARALELRGRSLGLRAGVGELLTLMEGATPPPAMLLLPDEEFRSQVEAIEEELGGP